MGLISSRFHRKAEEEEYLDDEIGAPTVETVMPVPDNPCLVAAIPQLVIFLSIAVLNARASRAQERLEKANTGTVSAQDVSNIADAAAQGHSHQNGRQRTELRTRTGKKAEGTAEPGRNVSMEHFTAEPEAIEVREHSPRHPNLPYAFVLGERFTVFELLGQGGYANVFNGIDQETEAAVAIKVQPRGDQSLATERTVYDLISRNLIGFKFPRMLFYGSHENYDFLVVEKMGRSVFDRWAGKRMPVHEASMLGRQIIYQLEAMHSTGVLHCDVKAENMLYDDANESSARLIDFGVSQCFMDQETGRLLEKQPVDALFGTWLFSPRSAHNAHTQCRRDDLESLGYVLISLMGSKLPWENYGDTPEHIWDIVGALKRGMDIGYLCREVADEMMDFMAYVRTLRFKEAPDYRYLRAILKKMSASSQAKSVAHGSLEQGGSLQRGNV